MKLDSGGVFSEVIGKLIGMVKCVLLVRNGSVLFGRVVVGRNVGLYVMKFLLFLKVFGVIIELGDI